MACEGPAPGMLRTEITELLNIEHPILQGGMAWVATAELAAAVSEAGGLGIIGAGAAPGEVVRREIRRVKELTAKPFGVNVMLLSPFHEEVIRVTLEERVPVVTTGAGNPGKWVAEFHERGIKVIPVVAAVALAKRLEKQGVDAVIAEGMESGGHIGEIGTMALVPQIVDAVRLPVVAAGGIADGRGVAAALALGAKGVQIGTRFICASEGTVHQRYKESVVAAGDRDAVVTGAPTGHPVRNLRNHLTREFERRERAGATSAELEELGTGRLRAAAVDGDVEWGSLLAGQSAGLVKAIQPAAEILQDLVTGAEAVLRSLAGLV